MTSYSTTSGGASGYLVTKSKDVTGEEAWKACAQLPSTSNGNDWCTNTNFNNSWLAITLPSAAVATMCTVTGRTVPNGNNFSAWVIEATNNTVSNDTTAAAATYTTLYTSNNQTMVGSANISFTVRFNNSTAYSTYRFRSTAGIANPGLTRFQLYTNINANSNIISNLVDPINTTDAATKNYVDAKIGKPTTSYQSITTSEGTTTLTASNDIVVLLYGSQSHTVVFPAASSLSIGARIVVMNRSPVACTINDTTQVYTINADEVMNFVLTTSSSWFNLSTCNYRSSSVIQREAISLSTITIAQNDNQSVINGKLQGQITDVKNSVITSTKSYIVP